MSVIRYNDVILPYPTTTTFRVEAVMDPVSGTDWCLQRYDVGVQCVINEDYLGWILPDLNVGDVTNPGEILRIARNRLLKPRRQFSMQVDGYEQIPDRQPGNAGTADAQNGPVPKYCQVVEMGNNTFLLTWMVVAHYWENLNVLIDRGPGKVAKEQGGSGVIYHRWSESVVIDQQGYSKRSRQGKLGIRSDLDTLKTVDQFRNTFASMSIPHGWVRESSQYTVSPDGLSLAYSHVDREKLYQPPFPATDATGYYVETTAGEGGAMRFGRAYVRLRGAKTTNRSLLTRVAISTCAVKLFLAGADIPQKGGGFVIDPRKATEFNVPMGSMVKIDLFENDVECMMTAKLAQKMSKLANGGIVLGSTRFFAVTPGLKGDGKDFQLVQTVRGTGNALLKAANYFDPSLNHALTGTTEAGEDTLFPRGTKEGINVDQDAKGRPPGYLGKLLESN